MLSRVLSIAGPVWVYLTMAVLVYGIAQQRKRLDWIALGPAFAGLLASAIFLAPIHRLFFDEDLYINIASNLTRFPVNQVTVIGGPDDIQVSSYYKEPAGWPVLLSFALLAAAAARPWRSGSRGCYLLLPSLLFTTWLAKCCQRGGRPCWRRFCSARFRFVSGIRFRPGPMSLPRCWVFLECGESSREMERWPQRASRLPRKREWNCSYWFRWCGCRRKFH